MDNIEEIEQVERASEQAVSQTQKQPDQSGFVDTITEVIDIGLELATTAGTSVVDAGCSVVSGIGDGVGAILGGIGDILSGL